MEFLSTDFVMDYVKENPKPLNELGEFTYTRTYSRWLENKGRREYWHETVKRAIEYNMALEYKHVKDLGFKPDFKRMSKEARELFKNIYNAKQFPSGRTLWIGNGNEKVNKDFVMGNFNCFSRNTEFLTDKGVKSFEDFEDGDTVNVLNANGKWAPATVRKFGESEIYKLTVKRGKHIKTISTTENHRWYAKNTVNYSKFETRTTAELSSGDVLRSKKTYEYTNIQPSKIGIMHGIVFGDGTYDKSKNHCRVHLIGEKKELVDLFTDGSVSTTGKDDNLVVYGLPSNWKELPSMDMNIEYLYGFLIGLFATDGSNTNNQHTISNADYRVMERIRDIALVSGINVGDIRTSREISPYTGEYSPLYEITLSAFDIKKGFHLRNKHHDNYVDLQATSRTQNKYWSVVSVEATGQCEEVWCVQEPETESFTLENGILTKNCSFTNIEVWEDLKEVFYLLMVGKPMGLCRQ